MKNCKIYASMILSILSSSKDKNSALQAVKQNFIFQGSLRIETETLFSQYQSSEIIMIAEFIKIVEQFSEDNYPYLASIRLKPTRKSHSHSS